VRTRQEAAEKLDWYAQRWKIETFHKILKSGCRAEEAKLRTAERLVNLIAILCILSWRIFWVTMLNRTRPDASPDEAFTELDQYPLDELVPDKPARNQTGPLAHCITKLARLGGYLARAHDPPPGNTVIWRGMSRLTDIELGIMIGVQLVGNRKKLWTLTNIPRVLEDSLSSGKTLHDQYATSTMNLVCYLK
jgi:hypothetical protein